ncbi:hypothetical protein SteCoe_34791 [Stentor coeruleus]|uniref:Attractin/MKLN-like beta-propeller domain-containing protein n=1 Tax=Stentor coeruleus TaxID=5963 RepID=A0A1R2ATT6_9CILI|nr:hypothetical protein SteCoe_34791 [Stentor coeruleus]
MFAILSILQVARSIDLTYYPTFHSPPSQRVLSVMAYHKLSNSLVVYSGYASSTALSDLWQFSLDNNIWSEKNPTSSIPDGRSNSGGFCSSKTGKFYIFGGNTEKGPMNDFWSYDFISSNWLEEATINTPLPRQCFGYTSFEYDGIEYFAVFGGGTIEGEDNGLYLLNMDTYEWKHMPNQGSLPPKTQSSTIQYYDGYIYVAAGKLTYHLDKPDPSGFFRYSIADEKWDDVTSINTYTSRQYTGSAVIDGYFYLIYGWSNEDDINRQDNFRVSLIEI